MSRGQQNSHAKIKRDARALREMEQARAKRRKLSAGSTLPAEKAAALIQPWRLGLCGRR